MAIDKAIRVDYSKALHQEPGTGHNRWHPDIEPILHCDPEEVVSLQTRDAVDGQIGPGATADDVRACDLGRTHPLTGPVYVNGAEPGDLLEVEIVEVEPDGYGYTVQIPGFGFLRNEFPDPYVVHWELKNGFARSAQLPGLKVPGAPFIGTLGVAPDRALMETANKREAAALANGGLVLLPSTAGAVPSDDAIAREALRTIPPRENVGNIDIKQLSAGAKLYVPVFVAGALFSAGDAHFAQGDCETCGTAIEMRSTLSVLFRLHKGVARAKGIRDLRFERRTAYLPAEYSIPSSFFATTGLSVRRDGSNPAEDLTTAARNALLNMIEYLQECGWSGQDAYTICSVAVDLRISELVDVPNFAVSAFLPMAIFEAGAPLRPA